MVPPLEESEDGNRESFSRWEKRSVISSRLASLQDSFLRSRKWGCLTSEKVC